MRLNVISFSSPGRLQLNVAELVDETDSQMKATAVACGSHHLFCLSGCPQEWERRNGPSLLGSAGEETEPSPIGSPLLFFFVIVSPVQLLHRTSTAGCGNLPYENLSPWFPVLLTNDSLWCRLFLSLFPLWLHFRLEAVDDQIDSVQLTTSLFACNGGTLVFHSCLSVATRSSMAGRVPDFRRSRFIVEPVMNSRRFFRKNGGKSSSVRFPLQSSGMS